jgi:MFS family permease
LNRNLTIICVTIFINILARFMWDTLLPLHLRALGANAEEIGISFTLIFIARTLFAVIGGALGDRYGRLFLIAAPTLAMGLLYLAAGISDDWLVVVAMLIAANAFSSIQWPPLSALITESSGEERAAHSYSLTETAVLSGLIAGPLVGAALLPAFKIPGLLILNGIAMLATGAWRAWGLREPARQPRANTWAHLRAAFDWNLAWIMAMGALVAFALAIVFGPFFAIFARDVWHNTDEEINLLFAAGNVAALAGIGIGRLSGRWGARRVLILSALGFALGAIVWGNAPAWQWGLAPLLIACAFSEAIIVAQQTLQATSTTRETRASVYGIISTTTGLAGGMGPAIGAWLVTLGGNALPFLAAGIAGLLAAVAVLPVRTRPSSPLAR